MKNLTTICLLSLIALGVSGCNAGMAPEGASGKQLQQNFDKLTPDQKIKLIENGPGTADQKKAQIDKIKADSGQPTKS